MNKEIVFNLLIEVFHVVQGVIFLTLLEILYDNSWIQFLLIFIAEKI